MTILPGDDRPEPPLAGDEASTLIGFLDYQRATLAWKCSGLDAVQLARTAAASSITLGGLLNHLALVEDTWFGYRLAGVAPSEPWASVDWDADPDWEWHAAARTEPEVLFERWRATVARSSAQVDEVLAADGLDRLAKRPRSNGEVPSLRWILLHMIEEYARHNGHADLIRESIDGQTGE
ncbi:uncharacterized protein DUF664 [Propionicimonas paludicola]|uniref:Uncharacterized protein DUF664 n=1 Tax=Propionicimonas paludicola TaxID=185243 RepID=A0A2A9CVY6_9ACTN|nr:DinB family protein [Propionicimonas paludicola]PFG17822.1 uncharacterized protein DUF664 [Propionicimonas paludicola]